MVIKRPYVRTVKKETLILSMQCLRHIPLQTRSKLRNFFKSFTHCCKLQTLFKNQRKLANVFQFKYHLPFDLVSGVAYKYTSGKWNFSYYGERNRHLKVKSGEHIVISPLTFRKVKPSEESAICDYLFNVSHPMTSLSSWHLDIINISTFFVWL